MSLCLPLVLLAASGAAAAEASASSWFQLDASAGARIAAGKAQLDELLSNGKGAESRGTQCWKAAVASLDAGCKGLDDEQQSRLAVAFTNCHFEKSGLKTYACDRSASVQTCTSAMATDLNGMPYSVYTTFYTHAESMCFYLQSAAFQERTEAAVSSLHGAVESASDALTR
ncbi:hypothetical protein T492DRAFT_837337 [Pavlovales sp. CCMP2436]|nr:hypothetical protein T492DRAFT_837337 [Pavlovales sp. CCMP2436]